VQAARRAADVALFGYGDEVPQRAKVHPDTIPVRYRVCRDGLGQPVRDGPTMGNDEDQSR
jgi:hypothetical protein